MMKIAKLFKNGHSQLMYGVEKSQYIKKNRKALEEFVLPLDILAFGVEASYCYGHIRASLEKAGTPIGALDFMIAAHAQSTQFILVSKIDSISVL